MVAMKPKCACPWCPNEAQAGCKALFSGKSTCEDHDWRALGRIKRTDRGSPKEMGCLAGEPSLHAYDARKGGE